MLLTNIIITDPINIHTKCHALIPYSSLPTPLLAWQVNIQCFRKTRGILAENLAEENTEQILSAPLSSMPGHTCDLQCVPTSVCALRVTHTLLSYPFTVKNG